MPLFNRFTTTQKGAMIFTGNTLGLSGARIGGGRIGSIRAFVTLDLASQVVGYPAGTTLVWQENESQAQLNIPVGATVLYAELQWGGTSFASNAGNVTAFIDDPINFTTPGGTTTVSPDPATADEFTFNTGDLDNQFYSRSQDVTALVQTGGSGTYSVGAVPGIVAPDDNAVTAVGWTLGIIYGDPILPVRNMSIQAGLQGIRGTPVDIPITGFLAPSAGPVKARILLVGIEGDPGITGDQVLFGPNTGSLVNLSGPNNLVNNFFASQINNGNSESPNVGQLDTSGTFGTLNSTPGSNPPQGVRQGWDITNVRATNLTNNQTQAILRMTSTGDTYGVPLVGIQLDAVEFEFDYGDAPDIGVGNATGNYSTLLANNGPRHGIKNELYLGTQVTPELDARQNSDATGDDLPAGVPDDGVILPIEIDIDQPTYTLSVEVTNNTGVTANVYGWVDFNQDGIFQDVESATATVASAIGVQTVDLTFNIPGGSVGGTTFARIRVTTDTLSNVGLPGEEDTRSLGLATDGEVEDYLFTLIQNPITISKSVDKNFTDLNEVLTYTIILQNTDINAVSDVLFQDAIPVGTTFIPGSVTVDVSSVGNDPTVGILISNMNSGEIVTITWQVQVDNAIPITNPIPNIGTVTAPGLTPKESNQVTTQINHAELTDPAVFQKAVDKVYADRGDTLTYTITTKNTGSTDADNIVVKDYIPAGTSLVVGSISADIPYSLGIGSEDVIVDITNPVAPEASFTVTYQVTVNDVLVANPIPNVARIDYNYTVDPGAPNGASGGGSTNQVETQINYADLTDLSVFQKIVDKDYADIGDILTYTIVTTNIGNVDATNVIVTDSLPNGTSLILGSIVANVPYTVGVPDVTVNITSPVAPGESIAVTFQVSVDEVPTPNPIHNAANIAYRYTVDPAVPNGESADGVTNEVDTEVNHAELRDPANFEKLVDQAYADIGDILTYTIITTNIGNVDANNVVVTDTAPEGTTLVPGSIAADVPFTIGAPDITINLDNPVPSGASFTVTFQVLVDEIPITNSIPNTADISYTYTVNPSVPNGVSASGTTNEVETQINHGEILPVNFIKSADSVITTEKETITYTLTLKNTGNVPVINVEVRDTLPMGIAFVPSSVMVNGLSDPVGNPETGITIGVIQANSTAIVRFRVTVNNNPPRFITNTAWADYSYIVDPQELPNQISVESNEVNIETTIADLQILKEADQSIVAVGEAVTYTLTVTNTGEVDLDEVIVKDLLDPALDFIEGSVTVNGFGRPLDSILTGVTLSPLRIGKVSVITFQAKVNKKVKNTIENQATAVFTFKFPADRGQKLVKQVESNLVVLTVQDPKLTITKEASKKEVSLNEEIIYKVVLVNTGDTLLDNVIFKDELSKAVELIEGSFTINGEVVNGVNLEQGVNIGEIEVGERVNIVYKVRVTSGTCNEFITNKAYATYNYVLSNHKTGEGETEKVNVEILSNISTFKQSAYNCTFKLSSAKPNIEELDDVSAKVKFIDSYVINTFKATSIEGQTLSGKKLIVHGEIEIFLEYTALGKEQTLHSAEWKVPMSEFIILPVDYEDGENVEIKGIIEDIEMESLGCREVEVNLMVLIVAKIAE